MEVIELKDKMRKQAEDYRDLVYQRLDVAKKQLEAQKQEVEELVYMLETIETYIKKSSVNRPEPLLDDYNPFAGQRPKL